MQKIDGILLDTYEMLIAYFLMTDKAKQVKFFEKIFLMTNVSLEVVFRMLFLILSCKNVDFLDLKLWWRIYTTKKTFLTTRHVGLVGKKEFVVAALEPEQKT